MRKEERKKPGRIGTGSRAIIYQPLAPYEVFVPCSDTSTTERDSFIYQYDSTTWPGYPQSSVTWTEEVQ